MRWTTPLLFVSIGLVVGAEPARQNPANDDPSKLQGAWNIVSVEIDGQSLTMDKLKGACLTIQGKRYFFKLADTRLELTCKLDSSKRPKAIDLIILDGPDKGKSYRGIYVLANDRYKICRTTMPDKARPTEFVTRPDSGFMIVVWKRANAASSK